MRLPSGFRDFPPDIARIYDAVISRIKYVFELYGFDPLYTPHLELWNTLKGKYGEEAEKLLIWRFEDVWSKDWYALRYDHTVPLARHFASASYPLPFKRYTVGSVFRHERAQRGRFREFVQADADIIGSPYPEADAELVNMVCDIMERLGFREFKVKISDRRILTGILRSRFGISNELEVFRAIDKLDKIGVDGVKRELRKVVSEETAEQILDIVTISGDLNISLKKLESMFSNELTQRGIDHLKAMSRYIIPRAMRYVEFALELVRGLDYYTGPVWEVIVEGVGLGSVGGGGRYDELLGIYTKKNIPATGTSFGVDRLVEAGMELGIYRGKSSPKVYLVCLSGDMYDYAWRLLYRLRELGVSAEIDLMRRKESKQRQHARRKNVKILVFIGKREIEHGTLTIYFDGERVTLKTEEAIRKVRELVAKEFPTSPL